MGFDEDARQAQTLLRSLRDAAGADAFDAAWQSDFKTDLPDWLTGVPA